MSNRCIRWVAIVLATTGPLLCAATGSWLLAMCVACAIFLTGLLVIRRTKAQILDQVMIECQNA